MNLKEWVRNVHLLQKCYPKILSILEIKNNSKKINNLEISQKETKIFQYSKIFLKKIGNYIIKLKLN